MKSLLYILETAAWTVVGVLVLLFFYGFLIVVVFNYRFTHTDLPWGMVWPLIWSTMGVLILGLIVMAWWWERQLNLREEAEQWLADDEAKCAAAEQTKLKDAEALRAWRLPGKLK